MTGVPTRRGHSHSGRGRRVSHHLSPRRGGSSGQRSPPSVPRWGHSTLPCAQRSERLVVHHEHDWLVGRVGRRRTRYSGGSGSGMYGTQVCLDAEIPAPPFQHVNRFDGCHKVARRSRGRDLRECSTCTDSRTRADDSPPPSPTPLGVGRASSRHVGAPDPPPPTIGRSWRDRRTTLTARRRSCSRHRPCSCRT